MLNKVELDHKVEIYIPSRCRCGELIDQATRKNAIDHVAETFEGWFGGQSTIEASGSYKLASGEVAREPITVVYAYADEDSFKAHATGDPAWGTISELDSLAYDLALYLNQESILVSLDASRGALVFGRDHDEEECKAIHAGIAKAA